MNTQTDGGTMALLLMVSTIGSSLTGCGGVSSDDVLVENIQIQDEEKPSETVPEKLSIQPGVVYYIGDHLDSAHMMVDSRGNVLREESRYPYGLDKRIDSESEVAADYVYTGKEYDDSTGLMYFGKRYYSPEMARWITNDPLFTDNPKILIEKTNEANIYAYVANNPIRWIDGLGLVIVISGSTNFKTVTNKALTQIQNTASGKQLYDNLNNSKNIHEIVESNVGNSCAPNDGYSLGKSTGSTVDFNPTRNVGGVDATGSNIRPPFVGLGHEMGHSEAIDQGTQSFNRGTGNAGTTPPSEQNSIKRENQIRNELSLPIRPSYY